MKCYKELLRKSQKENLKQASISFTLHSAKIKYKQSKIGIRKIIEIIKKVGFKATISNGESKIENLKRIQAEVKKKWKNSFIFSAIFGIL